MKARTPLLLLGCLTFAVSTLCAQMAARFSQSITVAERKEVGLERLTSDQTAVLDALVRRDMAARSTGRDENTASFSARLTPDERANAGLLPFAAAQVARLDELVARYENAALARTLLAPPTYAARSRLVEPTESKPERKIHGTFSLAYTWGSGGYSARTGAMTLRYDDPAGRYSVTVGYSETHAKGGEGYYYRTDDPALSN